MDNMHAILHYLLQNDLALWNKIPCQNLHAGYTNSGVAGQGGPGVRTPPPELPSGVHAKRQNLIRLFVQGVGVGGARQPLMTNSPGPPEPSSLPTPLYTNSRRYSETGPNTRPLSSDRDRVTDSLLGWSD